MSLSIRTPEPRRRAVTHEVPAAFKRTPRDVASTGSHPSAAPVCPPVASTADATRLFRHFEQQLLEGEHVFSQLRQDFNEWCREGGVTPPPPNRLSTWLKQAGLVASRRGRKKITVYAKVRRQLAA